MRLIKRLFGGGGGGGVVADLMRRWISETNAIADPNARAEWWLEHTAEAGCAWLEMTERSAPTLIQSQAQGEIAVREFNWYRVRRKELTLIVDHLDSIADLGPHHPDCLRALATGAATLLGARSNQTWANEWRFYVEGLKPFGVAPHIPVPPSFSGKLPPGVEQLL